MELTREAAGELLESIPPERISITVETLQLWSEQMLATGVIEAMRKYGEGNSAKLLAGSLGGKLAFDDTPQVIVAPQQNSPASGMNDTSPIADAPTGE